MRRQSKKNLSTVFLILIFLAGVGLLLYPTFADWWNSFHQSRAVASYMDAVTELDTARYDEILAAADAYNQKLAESGIVWTPDEKREEVYNEQLKIDDSGIMGYIDIPKINITLPIYHGTDENVLQVAIGHLTGTSLPVGGENTHCIVSGHRGLPSARLFTDIDKLVDGDTFTMTVLNRTVTYQVDKIRVVEPTDLSDLQIEKGKDLCTLVTCTPYGINTHRLLVQGYRVANAQGDAPVIADAMQIDSIYIAPFLAVPILIILVIGVFLVTGRQQRRNRLAKRTIKAFKHEKNAENDE